MGTSCLQQQNQQKQLGIHLHLQHAHAETYGVLQMLSLTTRHAKD